MTSVHIWCQNGFPNLREFPTKFRQFTASHRRFNTPVIHVCSEKLGNDQIARINYCILNQRELPNLQIVLLANRDVNCPDPSWPGRTFRTLSGISEFCPGTSIICVSLINHETEIRERIKREIRDAMEFRLNNYFIDLGRELTDTDFDSPNHLSEVGSRKLHRTLLKIITGMPMTAFLPWSTLIFGHQRQVRQKNGIQQ